MKIRVIIILVIILISSCKKDELSVQHDLEILPADTGGILKPVNLLLSETEFGYYVYTPSGYENNTFDYPLLLFLHGAGEKGNSISDTSVLKKVLNTGIPEMIHTGEWSPEYPMIVVMPQCHDSYWIPQKVHALIQYFISKYRVNEGRIYLTGLSMGGFGTFYYLQSYGNTYVTAAVPICGGGNPDDASYLTEIPIWAFHGASDNVVPPSNSINMINRINSYNPKLKAKITIYPGVGHDSWTMTYNGTGMGKESPGYDAFDQSIYHWMFGFKNEK